MRKGIVSLAGYAVIFLFPFHHPKPRKRTLTRLRLGGQRGEERGLGYFSPDQLQKFSPDQLQKLWVYLRKFWEEVTFAPLEFGGMFEYRDS